MSKRGRGRPPLTQRTESPKGSPASSTHRPTSLIGTTFALVNQQGNTDPPLWQSAFDSFKTVVEESIASVQDAIKQLQMDLGQAIEFQGKRIDNLESKMAAMGTDQANFSAKIVQLEDALLKKDEEINKLERISRRNNFRIVGVPHTNGENIENIVKDEILPLFNNPGIVIERCHRDGRGANGRPPHLLVRCLSYPMKVDIMKKRRTVLNGKPFFIVDDLTKTDLTERKKWAPQVKQLYDRGIRLRFSGCKWRDGTGKPYTFEARTT
ncbi:LINE-1 retrotransposable element ORF1 protein [Holothuria leucospilota]|uniref:LINE-1 retrotransposable element ORF1 protein n=1 Tax=Holothuria leucospilota TaxID=206669 RepID=A0A9Q1BVM4_HOLLE|nr:LINE-1 retrotransposable element ORF1 protein [Holothuria leucospilota]